VRELELSRGSHHTAVLALLVSAAAALALAPVAQAEPQASLRVSLSPAKLGAHASLSVSIHIADEQTEDGVPAPLRGLTIQLPSGTGVSLAHSVSVCHPAALRAHGAAGCPANSRIGTGRATLEAHAGSQTIPEPAALSVFRGPALAGGKPALELLGVGQSPLQQRSVSQGSIGVSPHGLQLHISIPPVHTLELEPDASFTAMSLTLGSRGASIVLPRSCQDGLSFAATLAFAGGSSTEASRTLPCPGA
jgi:hypothetical protein